MDTEINQNPATAVPRLKVTGITKAFGSVLANQAVDFSVAPGEVHALLGENGAGKSTLVKTLYGVLQPDSGQIEWEGERVSIPSPAIARRLGIAMVFQHFSLFDNLTVAENISLGLSEGVVTAALKARVRELGDKYGLALNPDAHVADLSVGEKQRVEIVRCLLQDPKLLIMDEPTSVLTPQEADRLFETLHLLRKEGISIIYISHKLDEIRGLCDHATILRGGTVVDAVDPAKVTAGELASLMIGKELKLPEHRSEQRLFGVETALAVENLSMEAVDPGGTPLVDVSFAVRPREIIGIAGVAGNGQSTLMAALIGESLASDPSMVKLGGKPVGRIGAAGRRELQAAFVPEERLGHASVPGMDLAANMVLTDGGEDRLVANNIVRFGEADQRAAKVIEQFAVAAPGPGALASSLSGGNLQKYIIGRELLKNPSVFVAAQPTWGIDAGAAARIQQALIDLADDGAAIVVISQDLDELLLISDRVAALCAGKLSPLIDRAEATPERVGLMMGGIFEAQEDAA